MSSTRHHIAELPFEPKCIATGAGWFCAGGCPTGRLASFRLPSSASPHRAPALSISSQVRVEKIGSEIINSISIHTLPRKDEADDVVALLTNNDCSVKIWSLNHEVQQKVEHFPFPMNHASISPDGTMMMIVGDQEFVYFYECVDDLRSPAKRKTPSTNRARHAPQWEHLHMYELHKPLREKFSGYFTTAWSPSGRLCACASEHGYITVFDTSAVRSCASAGEAIVAVIPSTQPCTAAGAVRCLRFAPDPWDLLLWTEHFGTFCVADLRQGLRSRQILKLDPQGGRITRNALTDTSTVLDDSLFRDYSPEIDYLDRFPQSNDGGPASSTTEFLRASIERRRLQRHAEVLEAHNNDSLTDEERMILDGLRTTRAREDELQRGTDPVQVHDAARRRTQQSEGSNRSRAQAALAQRNSIISTTLRDYLNSPTAGEIRRQDRVLSLRAPDPGMSVNPSITTPATTSSDPIAISPSREAWLTIESAMHRALNPITTREADTADLQPPDPAVSRYQDWQASGGTLVATARQRRERMRETLRDLGQPAAAASASQTDLSAVRRTAGSVGPGWRMLYSHDDMDPAGRHGTTGIAVSEDGRTV